MLTRFKVDGFKNLIGVDLRFGPYTCIAGANGSGKSNLLDAIGFLGSLADASFAEAIREVRSDGDEGSRLSDLMHRGPAGAWSSLRFECEMVIPKTGSDEFGKPLEARGTLLRYSLELKVRGGQPGSEPPLELVSEELRHIADDSVQRSLPFTSASDPWLESVLEPDPPGLALIECRSPGQMVPFPDFPREADPRRFGVGMTVWTDSSPRTVLSTIAAKDNATAYLVRCEMRSWRRFVLDAVAMRRPDAFHDPVRLGPDGSHMARTLQALAGVHDVVGRPGGGGSVLESLSMRLLDITDDLRDIDIDVDRVRERLRLVGKDRHGVEHDARSMSEGTLRFLALAVLELGTWPELICLEEPENGLHPSRIESVALLLQDIAFDPEFADGADNPMRQVIANTHSPGVVRFSPADSVLMAEAASVRDENSGAYTRAVRFRPLADSWRARSQPELRPVFITELLAYLAYRPDVEIDRIPENRVDRYADEKGSALSD